MKSTIAAKVKRFPQRPGIYIFTDARGHALYVGKAANLRARVRSYLSPGGDGRVRIPFLVEEAADVEFVATATEQEALLLENTVIKKRKPLYNVKLKDDKSFLMLRLDRAEPWPWFTLVRRRRNDGAEYFGPYASAKSVRRTLRLLHKVVPLRDCTDAVFHNRSRPCIKHQIGRCPAPCVGMIPTARYDGLLDEAVAILHGDAAPLLHGLQRQMAEAAEQLEFERAQALKTQIQALALVAERQTVVGAGAEDQDVVGLHRVGDEVCAVFLLFRQGKLESSRRFSLRSRLPSDLLLADLLGRFYEGDRYVPAQVLVPGEVAEAELVRQWLTARRGRKVLLRTPQRGAGRRNLVTAMDNARLADAVVANEAARRRRGAEELARKAGLAEAPETIHCIDVSTIQGKHTVASRVAFRDGRPDKDRYRRFKISSAAAGDDFSAMAEVVRRSLTLCLTKEEGELPDLLVVDGGRGQVTAAARTMAELGLSEDLALAGLAKSRLRGTGRERRASGERLFLPDRAAPVALVADAPATLLVAAIRDEAHRFAITYHRRTRGNLAGELDEIAGVGPARRRSILRHFGSLAGVRNATLEELCAVPGLPRPVAERVHEAVGGGAPHPRG
ncbi:MAG: excinuclease ABC subunit UvrC [Planctomycetota bacterium]